MKALLYVTYLGLIFLGFILTLIGYPVVALVLVAVIVGIGGFIYLTNPPQERILLLSIYTLGFIVRACAAVVLYHYLSREAISPLIFHDSATYDEYGWIIAQYWRAGEFHIETMLPLGIQVKPGYPYLVAAIYFLVGHNTLALIVLSNNVIGALIPIYIYRLAKKIYNPRIAKIALFLTAFHPALIFWASVNLKDTLVMFLTIMILWNALILQHTRRIVWNRVILILLFSYVLYVTRDFIVGILFIVIIVPYFLSKTTYLKEQNRFAFLLIVISIGVIFLLRGITFSGYLTDILGYQSYRTESLTGWIGQSMEESPIVRTFRLPAGIASFFLSPLPWRSTETLYHKWMIPSMLLWYGIMPFILYGIVHSIRRRDSYSMPLYLFIIIISFIYSFVFFGAGEIRYRDQVMPFSMIFCGVGLTEFKNWRQVYPVYIVTIISGLLLMWRVMS